MHAWCACACAHVLRRSTHVPHHLICTLCMTHTALAQPTHDQTEDGLLHVEWWSREEANPAGPEFDEIVFPDEATFEQVCVCSSRPRRWGWPSACSCVCADALRWCGGRRGRGGEHSCSVTHGCGVGALTTTTSCARWPCVHTLTLTHTHTHTPPSLPTHTCVGARSRPGRRRACSCSSLRSRRIATRCSGACARACSRACSRAHTSALQTALKQSRQTGADRRLCVCVRACVCVCVCGVPLSRHHATHQHRRMQEPSEAGDAGLCAKVNRIINMPMGESCVG
jgi:hypothetical protein